MFGVPRGAEEEVGANIRRFGGTNDVQQTLLRLVTGCGLSLVCLSRRFARFSENGFGVGGDR